MKRSIFSISLLFVLAISTAFAGKPSPDVNSAVAASFQKRFSMVKDVKWIVKDEYSKAEFVYAYSRVEAYFSNEGDFLGSVRNLIYSQLPIPVMSAVEKRFGAVGAYDVIEHHSPAGSSYYLTVETPAKLYRLVVSSEGGISVVKKTRKK
jgi:hypothetical protein